MHSVALLFLALGSVLMPATPSPVAVDLIEWEVVSRNPHDKAAFTQGLAIDDAGRLFESTGLRGESSLREVDPESGDVLRRLDLPDEWFGEGLAAMDDRLVQLTWQVGVATARDADTFELLETFDYDGEGWGLCFDGGQLVMSDGSSSLTFRDPETFEVADSVEVTLQGLPVERLNELECVDGSVWANIWYSDALVRIDPATGTVTGVVDLRGLLEPHPREADDSATLNGIAYDRASDTFLVTGKRWPELIEIRLRP